MTDKLDQEKRTALLDKISALVEKTEANGCTEAEALAAAEHAQSLMAKLRFQPLRIGNDLLAARRR